MIFYKKIAGERQLPGGVQADKMTCTQVKIAQTAEKSIVLLAGTRILGAIGF